MGHSHTPLSHSPPGPLALPLPPLPAAAGAGAAANASAREASFSALDASARTRAAAAAAAAALLLLLPPAAGDRDRALPPRPRLAAAPALPALPGCCPEPTERALGSPSSLSSAAVSEGERRASTTVVPEADAAAGVGPI